MIGIPENLFVLIDGSSYLYRAYYAFPSLNNSTGEPTSAIYGVTNMLRSLILQYQPTHAAVVFDTNDQTFRDELFEHYKSHRLSMPHDLQIQIAPIYAMIEAMGLPLIAVPGVEADDVIGTLARKAEKMGYPVLISTIDKDMAQLVTSKIALINTMKNTVLGPEEVVSKYGVSPEFIIDLLALMGDSSDNIPGVPGIGKKTAQVLIREIGGLDTLYSELEKVTTLAFRGAKQAALNLKKNKEIAYLSYQLATIKTNIELGLTHEQLKVQKPLTQELLKMFKRYEFKHWIKDIEIRKWLGDQKNNLTSKRKEDTIINARNKIKKICVLSLNHYEILLYETELINWIEKLKKSLIFSLEIETVGFNNNIPTLVGLSFAINPGTVAYIPVKFDCSEVTKQLSFGKIIELLKPILEDEKLLKIGQNLKYDYNILQNYNIELRGIAFDTMLESYVFDSTAGGHDINSLSLRWLKQQTTSIKEISDKNRPISNQTEPKKIGRYTAEKADIALRLHLKIWPELQKHKGPSYVFQNIEIPLIPVLARIERHGVKINTEVLYEYSKEIALKLIELERKAYKISGESFNLSSTKQLQTILFKKQGIKPIKKTPSGILSTSEEVLEELALDHPLPKIILEYRRLAKLKSTYTDKLPLMINPKTGRVHTSYHQAITSTGRLSSTDPNLQNIPIRNKEGRRIRQAFIAPENYVMISADYSQIELRVMAHFSRDKNLITAFLEEKDIHQTTAAEIFNVPLENITTEQRCSAKAINFGLIYGMSAFGLSRYLNISYSESQKYINLYFKRYPGVLDYIKRTRAQAKEKGYVETIDGRRLYLPDIKSNNSVRRANAERVAINAPIQGTAADIIKQAMISVDKWLGEKQPRAQMIMQVHDELVFEVHKEDIQIISKKINKLMESSIKLDIPLPIKIGIGQNWDQAH